MIPESPQTQATIPTDTLPQQARLMHFTIIDVLGRGGFGITYLVRDEHLDCDCVLKEHMPRMFSRRDGNTMQVSALAGQDTENGYLWSRHRFKEEAKTLAKLNHPNIIRVKDLFDALGTSYYVMEYIDGQELHHATETRRDEATLQHLLRSLLHALQYLHGKGLLHRDIKPSNILVTKQGEPVLIDFGTARSLISEHTHTQLKSQGYTPFEQIQTKGKVGPWTDLYALGATFCHVLTGQCPPDSTDRVYEDDFEPLAERADLKAAYSHALLSSIDKALQPLPGNRWQSAEEWLAALVTNVTTESPRPAATRKNGNLLDLPAEVEQRIQQSPILPQTAPPAKPITETAEEEEDELYQRCRELVIAEGKASTALLQRRCSIGYGRAARIMEKLARHGVIDPADGSFSRPCKVCISPNTPHYPITTTMSATTVTSPDVFSLPVQCGLYDYTILKVLGYGEFGITYLVRDEHLDCDCVLKEHMPRMFSRRDGNTMQVSALAGQDTENGYLWSLQRFKEEAKTLAKLDHPNIIRVKDLFDALGTSYYVMEYIDGQELHHATEARRDEATLQHLLRRLLHALQYLHGKGILHRDIKPSNILVTKQGEPILIDFGTAHSLISEHTQPQLKSPGYTPFEHKVGPWTDLYALGATFCRVLTGQCPPYSIDRVYEDDFEPLAVRADLKAAYSHALLSSIDKALQPLPGNRWQSAEEWLAALVTNVTTESPRPAAARKNGNLLDLLAEVEQRIQQSPILLQRRTAPPAYTTPILPQTAPPAKPIPETEEEEEDELYQRCRELVIDEGKASTALLQRRCSIGYGRAARIMEKLARHGVIDPADGSFSRPCKVCISPDTPH